MRLTDCRYDRDRLRLAVAYRLIAHEARTQTIRHCTGLSGDRIRKLYRNYLLGLPGPRLRRRRGKSPRQMAYFRKSVDQELQAAALGCMLSRCGLLAHAPRLPGPRVEDVARFCDVYETFLCICPGTSISFEHAWYLGQVLSCGAEYVLARCPDCRAAWIRDTLDLIPYNCGACRSARPPDTPGRDC